jgi:hypothetical protein
MTVTKTGAFRDKECTCECGNKHELYGGIGYKTISCESGYGRSIGRGVYRKTVSCRKCGAVSKFEDVD